MEVILHAKMSRTAHRSHLTRTYRKIDDLLTSGRSLSDTQIATLTSSLEQLTQKRETLQQLDTEIAGAIETPEDLEAEILEAEETQELLLHKISQIKRMIELTSAPTDWTSLSAEATEFVPAVFSATHSTTSRPSVEEPATRKDHPVTSRLPKLSLPNFAGHPLTWHTFWDSFNATVHSNPVLDQVQKFNYLRTQLHGDASRYVVGLPLTSANYDHTLSLLQNHFGEPQKIVNARMQALLDIY